MKEIRPFDDKDYPRINSLRKEAFRDPADIDLWRWGGWVLSEDGSIRAALVSYEIGHFFGGRSVPARGIASVMVATEARGKGYGSDLLKEVLSTFRAAGIPLSTLYPSSVFAYRRTGYELAGGKYRYRVPVPAAVPLARKSQELDIEPWNDNALEIVMQCYRRLASQTNGLIDRPEWWWGKRITASNAPHAASGEVYRYLVRSGQDVRGYLIYTQEPSEAKHGYGFSIICRDFVWIDRQALQALLNLVSLERTLGVQLSWYGSAVEPAVGFFDADIEEHTAFFWMARLVDVAKALEARGYQWGIETSLRFVVDDPMLLLNNRAFLLEVSGGQGKVSLIDSAEVRVDIGALAALYTGYLSARDAARLDRIVGASEEDIRRFELVFSGPAPWMMESF